MCTRRILPDAIPKSTNSIWQTSITPPLIEDSLFASDWAVVFRTTRWQDSHRDPDPRHDHVRSIISVAPNLKFSHLSCDISSSTSSTHLCNDVKSVLWCYVFQNSYRFFDIMYRLFCSMCDYYISLESSVLTKEDHCEKRIEILSVHFLKSRKI